MGRPSWLDSLSIRLTCLSCPEPGSPTTLGPESARANRNPDGSLELPAGQNVRVSFALTASALQPGRYELSASVPPAALDPDARRLNNLLMREALFEIRAPRSDLEVVESYLQLSHTLSQQGRHGDARETAERALEIKPNSIAATTDIGARWLHEGNCARATPVLQRSIDAIERGEDPDLRMSEHTRQDWAAALRGMLRSRCGQ